MRYGIRSISMDEIASQLGISKKTIYQYFVDKDALVVAVIDIEIRNTEKDCLHFHDKAENPVHEICLAIEMVEDMLRIMNPMVVYDLQKYHPAAFKRFEEHQHVFLYRMVKTNLEKGIEQELYRPEINVPVLSRFRLASILLVFNPEMFPLGKNDLGTVISELTMNFVYGIVTPKGYKLIQKYTQQRQKNHNQDEKRK